jgi:uncharacterized protein YbaR (Trm112 family)
MQFRKPPSHASRIRSANAEREAGIPDRESSDNRQPFDLDLLRAGGRNLRIEPRLGYVAWRAVDAASGEVLYCAALKELLHQIADDLPRMLAARNF